MNNQNENRISLLLPNNPADSKRKRLTSARPKGFVYREEKVKVDKGEKCGYMRNMY
jgi:hypothetical protein